MPSADRIPFEGVLNCWNDDHDLPDVLLAVSRSGKTGKLHFSNPEGDKVIEVREGRFTFAKSSSQDDGLGQFLLRMGKLSLTDYVEISQMVQPGRRLGTLLVEKNVLDASSLVPAVVGQVRTIILGLFRRTETWYKFTEKSLDERETITLTLPVSDLILDGVRYVESWRRISKGVGRLDSIYRVTGRHESEWTPSPRSEPVRELFDMLSEPVSLAEICTRSSLHDFEACRFLWALRCLGWIERVDAATFAESALELTPAEREVAPPTRPSVRAPANIPARLVKTRVAVSRNVQAPTTPTSVAASASLEDPSTQLSVEPPGPFPNDDAQTRVFSDPAPSRPQRSTGELMESILEGDEPETPAAPDPAPAKHADTQLYEGPSALGSDDDIGMGFGPAVSLDELTQTTAPDIPPGVVTNPDSSDDSVDDSPLYTSEDPLSLSHPPTPKRRKSDGPQEDEPRADGLEHLLSDDDP